MILALFSPEKTRLFLWVFKPLFGAAPNIFLYLVLPILQNDFSQG
ncbi:hypothetical protein M23134_02860 [Microscilla marina ATCC 23134]|uniref:Uncharacterized protein n=1 Tax=Microscilla marina ATCC 23134 TaxID=313606 RepID=A1ZPV8_MICM2|nr:hypothetical protein M23134_02860 [Microscilla marina ATCC 23134]